MPGNWGLENDGEERSRIDVGKISVLRLGEWWRGSTSMQQGRYPILLVISAHQLDMPTNGCIDQAWAYYPGFLERPLQ